MKIEKLFITGAIAVVSLLQGCVSEEPTKRGEDLQNVNVSYQRMRPTNTIEVSPKEGEAAVVIQNGDTIAITTEPSKILIYTSQYALAKSSEAVVVYVPTTGLVETSMRKSFFTLMFEDSNGGDADYNDVILHFSQATDSKGMYIKVQPIAMGNTKKVKLGADFYVCDNNNNLIDQATLYFSSDIKTELFKENDSKKIINTYAKLPINGFPVASTKVIPELSTKSFLNYRADGSGFLPQDPTKVVTYANWFIEDEDGIKYYAVPSYNTGGETWLNTKGYPFGLFIAQVRPSILLDSKLNLCGADWINYPQENVSITTVYPGFIEWIEGGNPPQWDIPKQGTFIDAMRIDDNGKSTDSLFDMNIW